MRKTCAACVELIAFTPYLGRMKNLLALLLAPMLSACLIVDDFGESWDAATPDICVTKLAAAFYEKSYKKTQFDYAPLIRPISLGEAHFILVKENEKDEGGHLYPFFVDSGVLITKRGNPAKVEYAKKAYGKQGVTIKESTVTIDQLNNTSLKLLEQSYHDESLWEEDLKMLYNKQLSDDCRFEDRDLEAER